MMKRLKDMFRFKSITPKESFASAFSLDQILRNLPFIFYLGMLAMVYIYNSHNSEQHERDINKKEKSLKELRWTYMTEKSELMFKSKQSEVAKVVGDLGLKELRTPPKKLLVEDK